MALTKLYGVKSTYHAGDDTYGFASSEGTFIIDGSGIDTISAFDTLQDVTIDGVLVRIATWALSRIILLERTN